VVVSSVSCPALTRSAQTSTGLRSSARMRARNSVWLNGLMRQSSAPQSSADTRSEMLARAVMTRMGLLLEAALVSLINCKPSPSGRPKSIT
jgi:hypothetical protein